VDPGNLTIGAFSVSIVLSIILRMIYNSVDVPNGRKPWIAVLIGTLLGIGSLLYVGEAITFKTAIDYMMGGFMTGATSVGFYEMTQRKDSDGV